MPTPDFVFDMWRWGVANAFVLAVAALAWRHLRLGSRVLDLAVYVYLCVFFTTLLTMGFGLAGALRPGPVFVTSAVGIAALGLAWWTGRLRAGPWGPSLAGLRELRPRWMYVLLAILGGALLVRTALHIWYLPPFVWDVLTYHLVNVAEWMQAERIHTFDTAVERIYWPACFEVFQTWFVLFLRHDVFVEAAGLPVYAVAVLSVYSIARSLSVSRRLSVFAAALYALTPGLVLHATGGKNDLPIAAAYLLVIAVLLDGHRRRCHGLRRCTIVWIALCLAMGTKPYIAFLAPGLLVFLPQRLWRTADPDALPRPSWLRRARAALGATTGVELAVLGLMAAAAASLGGYWFVRNWIEFGNPVYPQQVYVAGVALFEMGDIQGQSGAFSGSELQRAFESLFGWKLMDSRWPYTVDLNDIAGWGWFAVACGIPALLYGAVVRPRIRLLAAGFLVSLVVAMGWTKANEWNMRIALFFPALFALSFVLVLRRLQIVWVRVALGGLAAVCLLLNFAGTLDTGGVGYKRWGEIAAVPVAERSSAILGLQYDGAFRDVVEAVPPKEPLGIFVYVNAVSYPLYGPDFSRDVHFVRIETDTDVPGVMRELGIRFLMVPDAGKQSTEIAMLFVERGELERINAHLFALPDR